MKYKKYPRYKDSGIEWLGEIPEHWNSKRLKNVIRASITDGPHETPEFIDEGVPFLSVDGIQEGELTFTKCRYISESAHKLYKRKAFIEKDDILLGKAASIGKVARVKVNFEFSIWSPLALIKPKYDEVIASYLEYLLKSDLTQYQIQQLSTSNTQQNISMSDIPKFRFSLPERKEQQQIATFLDNAISKMDSLIEKQTKLIELLKEKRQAVISHAVTKGINPDVKMKNSGVEWLGDIPENWYRTKIKNILAIPITDGPHETPEFIDEGVPFISAEAISKGKINFEKKRGYISESQNKVYSRKYKPKLYDVYMIKSGATTGVTAIVEEDKKFNIWSPLAVFRASEEVNPYYLLNFLRSSNFQKAVELNWSYGTQQNIGMNVLENLHIAIPPIEEQQQIANYLDDKTSKIDKLIEKANKSIELLKEKRTALISAAVTGKIDVRKVS